MSALAIGLIAGAFCFWMVTVVKSRFSYDDSLDAFGVHGAGGTIGALLTGIFASSAINPIFKDATGNASLRGIGRQLASDTQSTGGCRHCVGLAIVGTLVILKFVDLVIGLRVTEEHEAQGLDLSQHGEEGYYWETSA